MQQPPGGNLFARLPDASEAEETEPLIEGKRFRVERIVSRGQESPVGFWYDQPQDEWVLVLKGAARIEIDEPPEVRVLERGHWILLPARCRHRVAWTDPARDTVWLAVHGTDTP